MKLFLHHLAWITVLFVSYTSYGQITVTNTSDAGPGSLRQAVAIANTNLGPDQIIFDPSLSGMTIGLDAVITITSGNGDGTTIDGDIDGDFIPDITIEPNNVNYSGIEILAANCTIRYLHIQGFSSAGHAAILISGSSANGNGIYGNFLGTDISGNAVGTTNHSGIYINAGATGTLIGDGMLNGINIIGGNTFGIRIANASNNTIVSGNHIGIGLDGSTAINNSRGIDLFSVNGFDIGVSGEVKNVIATGGGTGIYMSAATNGLISNNYIGVDVTGILDRGNATGIWLRNGSDGTQIGNGTMGGRNVIAAGNTGHGVQIEDSDNTSVLGNYIGVGSDGATPLANNFGILAQGTSSATNIGDGTTGGRNIISGGFIGVSLSGTGSCFIYGNYIGTDATGALNRGNSGAGVSVAGGFGQIGGTAAGQGNVISGNAYGIGISVAGYDILGNYIGTNAAGTSAIPNSNQGIRVGPGNGINIGDGTPSGANVISGNTLDGIYIRTTGTITNSLVDGNLIGVATDGISPLSNGGNGIFLGRGASSNSVIHNTIAHNDGFGILVGESFASDVYDNTLVQNAIYANTGGGISIQFGAQNGIIPPVITSRTPTSVSGTGTDTDVIHLYRDNSGNIPIQGQEYLGTTTVAGGIWSVTGLTLLSTDQLSATATDVTGSTSEFGVPPYTVTNTNDVGSGSLRWAIANANASSGRETITFNIPGAGPWPIDLLSPITVDNLNDAGMVIDGSTQPGFVFGSADMMIILDGANSTSTSLIIAEPGTQVYGFYIRNFDGNGLEALANSSHFTFGAPGAGNVVSGNSLAGLELNGSGDAILQGNRIGTSADGLAADGNGDEGIRAQNADNIQIGGDRLAGEGNLISGNGAQGIRITSSGNLKIYGNLIGTDATGDNNLGNAAGIQIENDCDNAIIGGTGAGQGNVVSGCSSGAAIRSTTFALPPNTGLSIENNIIGLNATGDSPISNANRGITITTAGTGPAVDYVIRTNTIAATSVPLEINNIHGNTIIEANQIGTDINGNAGIGFENSFDGIELSQCNGSDQTTGRIQIIDNIIVNSSENGIEFLNAGTDVYDILVQRNRIGIDASGNAGGNGGTGLRSNDGYNMEVGGIGNENIFANNVEAGIQFFGEAAQPVGSIIGVNSYFCNGTAGIDYTLSPSVASPIVSSLTAATITGTSAAADGSFVDVYAINSACSDNQGATYLGQAIVSGGNWSLGGTFNTSTTVTATVTDVALGISEFGISLSPPGAFITTWKTDNPGTSNADQITIPITGTGYDYSIDWGDGTFDASVTADITHTYPAPGTYTVSITGSFPRIYFNNAGDRQKILSVEQWGDIAWTDMTHAFRGCINLTVPASDAPDLSGVTSLDGTFWNCTSLNQSLNHWDVSTITNMNSLFNGATAFNQPLNNWNVSIVQIMSNMFSVATSFNQDISGWNTGNVTNMSRMFDFASAFNQPIGTWNVGNVATMYRMFAAAGNFNQNLNGWNVANVTTMEQMFQQANTFNQPLNNWNVGMVSNMAQMFLNATQFNQPLNNWNVSTATQMQSMFNGATNFDGDISSWNVSGVTNLSGMFNGATIFDQDISGWNVGSATNMAAMFMNASSFDQPIGGWNVAQVTDMSNMFNNATSFDQSLGAWDIGLATSLNMMLNGSGLSTASYDQTLIGWEAQTPPSGLTLGATGLTFCLGATAHSNLGSIYGWTIIDGGLDCINLTGTTPATNETNVPLSSNLTFSFTDNIDVATVNSSTILVVGDQTGVISGSFSGGGTNTITFDPTNNFKNGEIIRVSLTTGLQNTSGGALTIDHHLSFTAVSAPAPESPPLFQERTIYNDGTNTGVDRVAAIDMDLDGDLDVASIYEGIDEGIAWYQNNGAEMFTRQVVATPIMSFPEALAAADLDLDGDIDLLGAYNGRLDWYENDGAYNFTPIFVYQVGVGFGVQDIEVVDFDADGDLDIVGAFVSSFTHFIRWFENDGNANFSNNVIFSSTIDRPSRLEATDADGDGDIDILACWNGDAISWLENDGDQNLTPHPITLTSLTSQFSGFAIGDFNGDGFIDMAMNTTTQTSWFENDGAGNFSENQISTSIGGNDLRTADLDGDGDVDLVGGSGNLIFYENNGSGNFTIRTTATPTSIEEVFVADLDSDGDLDVIIGGQSSRVMWFENTTIGCASPPTANAGIDQSICGSSTVSLSGSIGNAATATWSTSGDGVFDDPTSLTATYSPGAGDVTLGTATLTLTTADPDGSGPCVAASDQMSITIAQPSTADAGIDQTVCAGATATLSGTIGGGAGSATWSSSGTGSFDNATSLAAIYTPSAADESLGAVTLTLTVPAAPPCPSVMDALVLTISGPISASAISQNADVQIPANTDVISSASINAGDIITVTITQNGTKGTATILANNTINYTANPATSGTDMVDYQICNQCGSCSSESITYTIFNQPPTFTSTPINVVTGGNATVDVLSFFSDPNNDIDPTTLTILTAPTSGASASINASNQLVIDYTAGSFAGTDNIEIEVCDTGGNCPQQIISVQVTNTAPSLIIPAQTTSFNATLSIDLSTLISDPEGNLDIGSLAVVQNPASNAVVSFSGATMVVDYSTTNFAGSDSFVIQVCDLTGTCAQATVTVTINNGAPTIAATSQTVVINGMASFDLSAMISDPDNNLDPASFKIISQPTSGAVAIINNGTLTIDYAGTGFAGTDILIIEACDLAGTCTQATITIQVEGDIIVNNGISPNGDGQNDHWIIRNIAAIEPANTVSIYSRWGDKVFEVDNYDNVNVRFEGLNDSGTELSSGIYFYKIRFTSGRKEMTGYLVIKR